MITAKCFRCGGIANDSTFEGASAKINHAAGLSHGIPCGKSYDKVQEIKTKTVKSKDIKISPPKTQKKPETIIKTKTFSFKEPENIKSKYSSIK